MEQYNYPIQIREPYEIEVKNFLFWIFGKIEKCALFFKNLKLFFTTNKISKDSSYIFLKTFV